MFFTGFADEASEGIDGQIQAIRQLGWSHIELRAVNKTNITDIDDALFDEVADKLDEAGVQCNAFGSTIANWGKSILDPIEVSLAEAERAIPRMKRLKTPYVRIMSFGILPDRLPEDQLVDERIERLQKIVDLFASEGLQALHENCANYGGMGWKFTQELLDGVKGMKLIFDTANAGISLDFSKPKPYVPQDSWEFYEAIKEHIVHVHIKDGTFKGENPEGTFEHAEYTFPGEGNGQVRRIVGDLLANGYEGGLSIEPHLSVVFHDHSAQASEQARFDSFVEYGRRLEAIVAEVG
ncbi:MAG: sugar phosphate isomerase/epimerase family protein [Planctomycetota bacterium]